LRGAATAKFNTQFSSCVSLLSTPVYPPKSFEEGTRPPSTSQLLPATFFLPYFLRGPPPLATWPNLAPVCPRTPPLPTTRQAKKLSRFPARSFFGFRPNFHASGPPLLFFSEFFEVICLLAMGTWAPPRWMFQSEVTLERLVGAVFFFLFGNLAGFVQNAFFLFFGSGLVAV